ncbi:hypothetical protein [Paratractidigestivibacter sp.]|uniref:hypothetical protein n=1 Tax=Paratractidigestivibacter sp. TaxID=2847316 RepID=UPI002AC984E6|nr:hypothetical protein [Paratractidigestivibacter sp.]
MSNEYEIRIQDKEVPAKALMELKGATGLPLGELRRRVLDGEAVLGCQCSDDDGLARILALHDSLLAQGIRTSLYEDGRLEDVGLFWNLLESWRDTSREVGLNEF